MAINASCQCESSSSHLIEHLTEGGLVEVCLDGSTLYQPQIETYFAELGESFLPSSLRLEVCEFEVSGNGSCLIRYHLAQNV